MVRTIKKDFTRRQFTPRVAPAPHTVSQLSPSTRLRACLPASTADRYIGLEDEQLARVMEKAFAPSTLEGYGSQIPPHFGASWRGGHDSCFFSTPATGTLHDGVPTRAARPPIKAVFIQTLLSQGLGPTDACLPLPRPQSQQESSRAGARE
ncbi:unnamed protein product [Tilletia controversa]|nr:unnamed protein product [Tilletia controversa]